MTRKKIIEPGTEFGKWMVLEDVGSDPRGMSVCLCQCSCSRRFHVLSQNLTSGMSRQCRFCSKDQPFLTVPQAHELREALKDGYQYGMYAKFGRKFGVSGASIKRIVRDILNGVPQL